MAKKLILCKGMINQKTEETKKKNVIYIFIDASNVWNAIKSVKKFIEYKTLKDYFRKNFNADKVEIFYYDAYPKVGTRGYSLDEIKQNHPQLRG